MNPSSRFVTEPLFFGAVHTQCDAGRKCSRSVINLRKGRPMALTTLTRALRAAGGGDSTVHGWRSVFKDWASERTTFPKEVSEMALAHTIGDKVEAAYRRGELMQK